MIHNGLVVIPSYNEEHSVVSVCRALQAGISGVDILVVDDGSEDESVKQLRENAIDFLRHPQNLGYVEALRSGLMVAIADERPFVCFFDADGQHRVEDLLHMIEAFHKRAPIDILVASRFLSAEAKPTSVLRGLGNNFFCRILQLLTGRTFTDVSNGLKVLSLRAAIHMSKLPLEDAHAELLFSAVKCRFVVEEYPVIVLPRTQGKSMITLLKALWYPLRTLLALVILYPTKQK